MSYEVFAICAVATLGLMIVVFFATEQYDARPIDIEDHPEVDTPRDQRFRQADGQ